MSALLRLSFVLLAFPAFLSAAELSLVRVWPEYRSAESFERIGEYFGKPESHPGLIVLRSQPQQRAGYYFLARITEPAAVPAGSSWLVEVILPGSEKPKSFNFPFDAKGGKAAYELGLTGSDWPNEKTNPTAWRLSLVNPEGRTLLSKQSFLWR